MTSLPRELAEWLPSDVSAFEVEAWACVARTFDRIAGEVLLLRMRRGEFVVLTRPEVSEEFRALPLADEMPVELKEAGDASEPRLRVRVVDGRMLTLPIALTEVEAVQRTIDFAPRIPTPIPRAPSNPATIRPPATADAEVVRIPDSVRPAFGSVRPLPGSMPRPRDQARASAPPPASSASEPGQSQSSKRTSARPPAFAEQASPIVQSARDLESLRASFRHHWSNGALDEATQVGRALVHLGVAEPIERRLARLRPEAPSRFDVPLSAHLYRAYLAHEEEDSAIGRLLGAITPAYLDLVSRPDYEIGLRPRDEIDFVRSREPIARLFAHTARALGIERPRLFVRTDVPGGMAHIPAQPIASLCGGTLATAYDDASVLHVLGHHLSFYRPEAYLIALLPAPHDLLAIVLATLRAVGRIREDDPRIDQLAARLAQQMAPEVRDLVAITSSELSIGGHAGSSTLTELLRLHRRAAHLTAVRSGFVLAGSLEVTERMQRVMPVPIGLTQTEMLDDVITYSVGPSWITLRKELDIAIAPSDPNNPAAV